MIALAMVVVGACSGSDAASTVLDVGVATTTSTSTTTTVAPTTTSTATTTTTLPPTTTTTVPSPNTIARSVVRVYAVDPRDRTCQSGSAVVVAADGLLLTNQHVTVDDDCAVRDFLIGVAPAVDAGVEVRYRARVVTADEGLDLAVLRIDRNAASEPEVPVLEPVQLGDAGTLQLSDSVLAFGFPGAGSDPDSGESTITVSRGTVVGFLDERKWIKTDAAIAPGSSGGGLFDGAGRLVGVPTRGAIGSGIGQARSVNVALPLIAAASAPTAPAEPAPSAPPPTAPPATASRPTAPPPTRPRLAPTVPPTTARNTIPTVPPTTARNTIPTTPSPQRRVTPSTLAPGTPAPPLPAGFDPAKVTVRDVSVSPGKAAGKPVAGTFGPGTAQVCVFWRTTGLAEGAPQRGRWYLDGTLIVDTWIVRKPGLPAADYLNWCLPATASGPMRAGTYRFTYDVGTRNMIDVRAVVG